MIIRVRPHSSRNAGGFQFLGKASGWYDQKKKERQRLSVSEGKASGWLDQKKKERQRLSVSEGKASGWYDQKKMVA
jgi:hypothetical protein